MSLSAERAHVVGSTEPDAAAWLRRLVADSTAFVVDAVGAELEAVVLTGSVARDEASVLATTSGWRLLGDIEYMVMFKSPRNWAETRRRMADLSRRATNEIGDGGRRASIEYGASGLLYLRRNIRPAIFSHELLQHGRVVWGRPDMLTEARPIPAEAIPREDAVALVMNRTVELLPLLTRRREDGEDPAVRAYQVIKTLIDLAGSALAFSGGHVSRYGERPAAFERLLLATADLRTALPSPRAFVTELSRATACKLAPTSEHLAHFAHPSVVGSVAAWAKGIWIWEMRRLLGQPSASPLQLLDGFLAHEPLGRRLRGWVKLLLHPLRPSGTFSALRMTRLWWRGSPQALTYAAALLVFWSATGDPGIDLKRSGASLVPVRRAGSAPVTAAEVSKIWHWLIRNN